MRMVFFNPYGMLFFIILSYMVYTLFFSDNETRIELGKIVLTVVTVIGIIYAILLSLN
jgi:hypothetical protein